MLNNLTQINNGDNINENDKNAIYKNYISQNLGVNKMVISNNLSESIEN